MILNISGVCTHDFFDVILNKKITGETVRLLVSYDGGMNTLFTMILNISEACTRVAFAGENGLSFACFAGKPFWFTGLFSHM